MRAMIGVVSALAFSLSAPAMAQSVGMPIVDVAGGPVATVTAIQGDNLQIKTDKHEVLLPKASFTVDGNKLLFGLTQAQLNAKIEESTAASQAAIVAGATVNGSGGAAVGKIEAVDADQVTIALTSGQRIQVASTALRGNPDQTVSIGYSAEQLEALVNQSTPAADTGK